MVAGAAAELGEELQALDESGADLVHGLELLLADGGGELADVLGKAGLIDVDGLVGAEGGADLDLDGGVGRDLLMPLEGVDGIVGGADEGDVGLLDDAAHGEARIVLQLFVAEVPGFLGGLGSQGLVEAEELPELQVAPVVHGVADGHLQGLDKLQVALVGGLVAGDVVLADAVGAHDAPLVVVAEVAAVGVLAAEPDFDQVVEAAVFVDLAGRDVAVVVGQGLGCGIVVVQVPGSLGLEQKVFIHEFFHLLTS